MIDKGQMVYFGRADQAKAYFTGLGFATVPRQTTPDFLVSVTTDQRKFRDGVDERSVPKTAVELADAFRKSELGRRNVEDVERYKREFVSPERRDKFTADARAEKAKHVRAKSSFVVGYMSCVDMRVIDANRNKARSASASSAARSCSSRTCRRSGSRRSCKSSTP